MSRSAGKLRLIGADRRAPIDPLEQHRKLCRCQCRRRAEGCRWPNKAALLKPLGKQTEALAIPPQHFDQASLPAAEDKGLAGERIVPEMILDQRRQPVEALAHVRSRPLRAIRAIRQAPGSSANQDLDHAPQYRDVNRDIGAETMTTSKLDLNHGVCGTIASGGHTGRSWQAQRDERWLPGKRCGPFRFKRFAAPPKQQAGVKAMAPRDRRRGCSGLLRLGQDRLFLLRRPRAPCARDDDVRRISVRSRHSADTEPTSASVSIKRYALRHKAPVTERLR